MANKSLRSRHVSIRGETEASRKLMMDPLESFPNSLMLPPDQLRSLARDAPRVTESDLSTHAGRRSNRIETSFPDRSEEKLHLRPDNRIRREIPRQTGDHGDTSFPVPTGLSGADRTRVRFSEREAVLIKFGCNVPSWLRVAVQAQSTVFHSFPPALPRTLSRVST